MEEKLRNFLKQYIGRGTQKNDTVTEEDVDLLVETAIDDHIEQEIIDYGTAHPDAPFWDFLNFIQTGLKGITQEELLKDDDEDLDDFGLSEYVKTLMQRYGKKDLDEEESDILYFMIGNPGFIGKEEEALAYLNAHPKADLTPFYEHYIEEIIPAEYRKQLAEMFGWEE